MITTARSHWCDAIGVGGASVKQEVGPVTREVSELAYSL